MAHQIGTRRQRRGAASEEVAAQYLTGLGWRILARNVRLGRDEVDLLAFEPAQPSRPATVVVVEVRGLRSRVFGAPEERVDRAKVARLYRAASGLRAAGQVGGVPLPAARWRVDLVVVDERDGPPRLRHLRAVEPP
jgi:putative endonuclease